MDVRAATGAEHRAALVLAVAAATVVVGLLGAASELLVGPALRLTANLGVLLLSGAACAGCAWAAVRVPQRRRAWAALAVAGGSWALGQAVWTVFEDLLGDETPFPSLADVGYLGLPLAAALGLWWLPDQRGGARRRRALDGLLVAGALSLLSWSTVVRTVVAQGDGTALATVVALAYPASDVVLVTIAVLAAAQVGTQRVELGLIATAMVLLALSDGAFAYLGVTTGYATGSLVDAGWWAGFGLLGVVGVRAAAQPPAVRTALPPDRPGASLLPYAPLVAAVAVTLYQGARGTPPDVVVTSLVTLLVALVLLRQYLTVQDNAALVHEVEQREDQLRHRAFHDELTGLANRALFLDRLTHALELAERSGREVSVAFVDLDDFKVVNDTLGHTAGDEVLVRVAERLRGALRSTDTLARLGGDEFAVLLEAGEDPHAVAATLLEALRTPFAVAGRNQLVSASIGVASHSPGTARPTAGSILHSADVAMYAVKRAGKSGTSARWTGGGGLAGPTQDDRAPGTDGLAAALGVALAQGVVAAHVQLVAEPCTGRVLGGEVLARWTHEGRAVAPDVFVPLAEQLGLSGVLTALVLERTCAQLDRWNRLLGHRELCLAVNVDPAELTDPELPARLADLLARHRLAPGQLALEITERGPSNRLATSQDVLLRLRGLGVRLVLDDFGTGYTTFAQLSRTPLDAVKIDRSFSTALEHDDQQRTFMEGVLRMTRHLGLHTVVEGVERPGQLRVLQELGTDAVQGYLLARPVDPDELTPLLLSGAPLLAEELRAARIGGAGAPHPVDRHYGA